ncbi:MAG TPA: hypothetical protein VGD94_15650 [Vicinamibacterales bacterium]
MLLTFSVVVVLVAGAIGFRLQALGGGNTGALGWMSEQWLSEHRASHPD